jgi:hypothetical protein
LGIRREMRARFISNVLLLLLGAWLMADRFLFGHSTVRWISFGSGSAIASVCALAFLARGRGALQRLLDVSALVMGGWMIVASQAYSPHTIGWIGVGVGGGAALSGLIGLVNHELLAERALAGAVAVAGEPEAETARRAERLDGASSDDAAREDTSRAHDGQADGSRSAPVAIGSWPR